VRKRKVASIAFTGAAVAATTGFNVPAAFAAGSTWTVTPGGPYTATATGTANLLDVNTSASLTCSAATAAGALKTGSGQSNPIGTISQATFGSTGHFCTGPLGTKFTAALKAGPWDISAVSTKSGTTTGKLTHISASITGQSGFGCKATVSGSVPMSYQNATHALIIDTAHAATLTVKSTNGACLGAINSGDQAWFSGTYNLSPAQTITSP
jgi:hypothetical protein